MASTDAFLFYETFWDQLKMLDIETRGIWITAMCKWAFDQEDAEFSNPMLAFAWQMMRGQLENSVKKHASAVERGSKGGRPKGKKTSSKTSALRKKKSSSESDRNGKEWNGMEMSFHSSDEEWDASAASLDASRVASGPHAPVTDTGVLPDGNQATGPIGPDTQPYSTDPDSIDWTDVHSELWQEPVVPPAPSSLTEGTDADEQRAS